MKVLAVLEYMFHGGCNGRSILNALIFLKKALNLFLNLFTIYYQTLRQGGG